MSVSLHRNTFDLSITEIYIKISHSVASRPNAQNDDLEHGPIGKIKLMDERGDCT